MKSKKISSLKIISSIKEMQKISLNIRKKGTHKISVIPTMGALHEGHLSLIKKAQEKKIITIVTIFVNPIQFDDKKDLTNYPSNLKNDIHKLKSIGVNYLFTPNIKDIYPEGYKTKVVVENLKNHLCGLKRPGHFDGVTSVVLKIFNITLPHKAFFGEKDLQQLIIIKQMVNDLNLPIKVISHPIVREKSGLAMSSRNLRLSTNGKKIAPFIYRGVVEAKKEYKKNSKTTGKKIINNLKKYYAINNIKHIDYIEVINPRDISYPLIPRSGDYILTAIKIGKIRLIDNLKF